MLQSTLKLAAAIIAVALVAGLVLGEKLTDQAEGPGADPAARSSAGLSSAGLSLAKPERLQGQVAQTTVSREPDRGAGAGERLVANAQGHFSARLEVNGVAISTLVDTGATLLAFSAEDAESAGLRPLPSEYRYRTSTANGDVAVAVVKVRDLRLGSIELHDVDAAVLPRGALRQSLLGMSFLKRLALFQVEGDTLILRQ